MRNSMKNRFAALLLVVCMLVTFIPTGFAADGEEFTGYVYDMARLQWGQWSTEGVSPESLTTWESLGELKNYHKRTSDPFMFYGKEGKINISWASSSGDMMMGFGARGTAITGDEGAWYGIIIRVEKDGVYAPAMRAADQTSAASLNYYLAPYGVKDPMAEQYFLGTSVNESNNAYSLTTCNYPNQYLPAGDYIVIVEIEKNKATSGCYGFFSRAELNWVSDDPSEALTLAGSADTGYIDEETEIALDMAFDGADIAIEDLDEFRIDSLDAEVATVREEGGKFYAFGVWEGETAIRVSARKGDDANTIDIPFTVEMPQGYQRIEIWPGEQPTDYFANQPTTVSMRYTLNREETTIAPSDISVTVKDPSVASAEVDEDSNLVITGVAPGSTTVTLTATVQGKGTSVDIPVTVSDIKYFYNYYRGYYGPWSNSAHPLEYFTDFGMFVKGEGNNTNGDPDHWEESDDWKFGGKSTMFTAKVTASFRSLAYMTTGGPGEWVNMVIRVPEGGAYQLEALNATIAAGAIYNVYVSPVGTPEEDWLNEEYFVSKLNCSGAGTASDLRADLGNVTLESGDYNVVYEFTPELQVGNGGFLCGLYLKAIKEDQFKLFANTPAPIAETTHGEIPLVARWNGGSVGFADVTDLAVVSANESIATATVVQDGDEAHLEFYGVAPGKTTLTVTATRGGLTTSYDINVDIASAKRIYSVELSADKTILDAGESLQTTLSGVYYDGTPIDFAAADDLQIYYESLDGSKVVISDQGVVTAKEKGESEVRVWVKQGETVCKSNILFAVEGYSAITETDILISEEVKRGATVDLGVSLKLSSGYELPSDLYTVEYSLESMEPSGIARLSGTKFRGTKVGTVVIKAVVTFNGNPIEIFKTVQIVDKLSSGEVQPRLASIKLSSPLMSVGESRTAEIGVYYTDASYVPYDADSMTLTYDDTIISYENGVIRALQPGSTDFTLTMGDLSETVAITVDEEVLSSATIGLDGDLYEGKTANLSIHGYTNSGRELNYSDLTVTSAVAEEAIATIDGTVISGVKVGDTSVTVTVELADAIVTANLPITVLGNGAESIVLSAETAVLKPNAQTGIQTSVTLTTASGDTVVLDAADVTFESLHEDILSVDAAGVVLPVGKQGTGTIRATVDRDGRILTSDFDITVREGKVAATFFTPERRAAIQENVANYQWAKTAYNSVDTNGKKWAGREDWIMQFATTQELPRNIWPMYRYDPKYQYCAYCGENIVSITGNGYPWLFDNENYPFKLQCPECRRRFPSNDFKAFYETGIDEEGNWRYQQALENGSHLLYNKDYPEKGEGWGVDDGYGYGTGEYFDGNNGRQEHTYTWIAYWNHWGVWYSAGTMYQSISNLSYAYVYTGKPEYGRTLAILVDRVADLYPDMDTDYFGVNFYQNGWYGGRLVGGVWETGVASMLARAYDAAFDMYDDPYVQSYIQKNAAKWGKTNKDNATKIRQHIEDNLLREIRKGIYDKRIYGNEGMHEGTMVYTAVVLDNMPESKEMIDWALTTGPRPVLSNLISKVDREGQGTENSPNYNILWVGQYSNIAEALGGYTAYSAANFYTNPKFIKLLKMNIPLTMTRNYTLQIGDSGGFATTGFFMNATAMGQALVNGSDDPELAQFLYFMNGNSATGTNGTSIMVSTKALEEKIQKLIDEHGEYDFDKSTFMPGWGASILRDGTYIADKLRSVNTQRSVSLWYGSTGGHGQGDTLNLMMDAYGLNVMPTLGYPTTTLGTGDIINWERSTIGKNTVVVNDKKQEVSDNPTVDKIGKPLHFDDSGRVKVIEGENLWPYRNDVSKYRRTAVMIEVNDEDAYTLDFFRIKGGNEHVYSFHANSNEITGYEGLKPNYQPMGTYAGPDVKYGPGNILNGYDAFYDVYRSSYPGKSFSVDFKIHDFRKVLKEDREIHVRMTQVNTFDLSDVSMASARPPVPNENPSEIKYVLARRSGKDLDSLFTTVIEPYDKNRYVESIESVPMKNLGTATSEPANAVKVTLKNGRVDYIVYASNDTTRYLVDDKFEFMGYVGVVSYQDGEVSYRYMHDSKMIADMYGDSRATGQVVDFTKDLAFENSITVRFDKDCDVASLAGKAIFISNTAAQNGTYWIHGATENRDGSVTLDIGDITLINSMANGEYVYNIAAGQKFYIPLTTTDDSRPIVKAVPKQAVAVGNTLTVPIVAESPVGRELTYRVANNVSGAAMVDNVLYFSPADGQTGNIAIAVEVSDGITTTTVNIDINVFPATSSGGGGGGNGGTGGDTSDEVTYTDNGDNTFTGSDGSLICAGPDKTTGTADDITNVVEKDGVRYIKNADGTLVGAGADGLLGTADDAAVESEVAPSEKFVDLGNHAWAKDAIYRLVEAGVIKGVADDRFAPAAQITRADFAILLVRAWNLTADEIGTYDDVAASDYFANEVGIAAANGIVNGVGEGKFAPRAPITREQMMVMLHRTLSAQGIELDTADDDVLATFSDADAISDYAVDAVKLMVANGYIQGSNGKINPQGNATRAEVAVLLDRILNK